MASTIRASLRRGASSALVSWELSRRCSEGSLLTACAKGHNRPRTVTTRSCMLHLLGLAATILSGTGQGRRKGWLVLRYSGARLSSQKGAPVLRFLPLENKTQPDRGTGRSNHQTTIRILLGTTFLRLIPPLGERIGEGIIAGIRSPLSLRYLLRPPIE